MGDTLVSWLVAVVVVVAAIVIGCLSQPSPVGVLLIAVVAVVAHLVLGWIHIRVRYGPNGPPWIWP